MSRYSRRETYGDGEYVYDDRYDAGEFATYGQSTSRSRGPSSGEYYHGDTQRNETPYATSYYSSRREPSDVHGYARQGSYAGEESLRRRLHRGSNRHTEATYNDAGPRTRLDRDTRPAHEYGQRSRLSQQVLVEENEAHLQARRDRLRLSPQRRHQHRRETRPSALNFDDYPDGNPYVRSGRSERRGAATAANDPYLANVQAARDEQERANDTRPSSVHGLGRGWFPAYEYR